MNEMPTSGPIASSKAHQARDTTSSRHSFSSSQRNGRLCECKEHLFEVTAWEWPATLRQPGQFRHRAFAAHAAAAQEDEAIAETRCVRDLMNGEKQRTPARR